jgi:hypothetical protein
VLAVDPVMAKTLTVITLHHSSLGPVSFDLYDDTVKAGQTEDVLDFLQFAKSPGRGKWRLLLWDPQSRGV